MALQWWKCAGATRWTGREERGEKFPWPGYVRLDVRCGCGFDIFVEGWKFDAADSVGVYFCVGMPVLKKKLAVVRKALREEFLDVLLRNPSRIQSCGCAVGQELLLRWLLAASTPMGTHHVLGYWEWTSPRNRYDGHCCELLQSVSFYE